MSLRRSTALWTTLGALALILLAGVMTLRLGNPQWHRVIYCFQAYCWPGYADNFDNHLFPEPGYSGVWYTYHANLGIDSEMHYQAGELHGTWTRWDEEGNKWWRGTYDMGHRVGDWTWWNPDGSISHHEVEDGSHYEPPHTHPRR